MRFEALTFRSWFCLGPTWTLCARTRVIPRLPTKSRRFSTAWGKRRTLSVCEYYGEKIPFCLTFPTRSFLASRHRKEKPFLRKLYYRGNIFYTVGFCENNIFFYICCVPYFSRSVRDPDPHVFGPPGTGSISQRYGSGSFPFLIKVLSGLKIMLAK